MCSVVLLDWPRFPSPHYTVGFPGHVQRFFNHTSHMGYRYIAAELSIGCPVGLSGAPVFNSTHMGRLYGVVAENVRTETEVETVLEIEKGNVIDRETMARVIHYALAVWLPDVYLACPQGHCYVPPPLGVISSLSPTGGRKWTRSRAGRWRAR